MKALFGCGLMAVLMVVLASSAPAGGSPSDESCKNLGKIEVRCTDCATGDYIGTVTVDAEFGQTFNGCNGNYRQAWDRCASAYSRDKKDIGMTWEYWLSGTKYSSQWPKGCIY